MDERSSGAEALSRGRGRGSSPLRTPWAPPLLVLGGALLVYLNTLGNGFAFDDVLLIVVNPATKALGELRAIGLTPYWPGPDALARGLYRPLTIFAFAVQWALGGGSPLPFHLANVLLHGVASVLVYALVREMVGWRGGLAGGLLFAVHPVHVEAVANGVGQAELLAASFVLLACLLHLRRAPGERHGTGSLILIPLLYMAGTLAKEGAIVLPGLLLVLDVARGRDREPGYGSAVTPLAILLLGAAALSLAARWVALDGGLVGDAAYEYPFLRDPAIRLLTALSVWPEYVRLLFFPARLSAMYDPATLVPAVEVSSRVLLGGLLLAVLLVAAVFRRGWPALGSGAAWLLLTLLPTSNLLFPVGTLLAERTLYLPSVALSLWVGFAAGALLPEAQPPRVPRPLVLGVFTALLLTLGTRTVLRNPVWASDEVLFGTTLRQHPESFRAQWFEALRHLESGDAAGSLPHWDRALAIYPWSPSLLTDYANFLLRGGALDRADEMAARALEIRPDSPNGIIVKGMIEVALGRTQEARGRIEALRTLGFPAMAEALEARLK